MKQKLRACARRIGKLEYVVAGLTAKEKALRANGDDAGANDLALKIKGYKAEWSNKIKELDELLEKPEADSASREQTEAFLLEEFRAMYVRLLHTAESWMRNHYSSDEDRSLWDMFVQDHPEMA